MAALQSTDIATASTFLKGAVNVTLRNRVLLAWLDKQGRINRNAEGKDLNWLIRSKEMTAQSYVPGQPLTFTDDNFNQPALTTPSWLIVNSGMNVTSVLMNTGGTAIVDNYKERVVNLAKAMQNKLSRDIYADATTNTNSIIGLGTICKKSGTIATANTDKIAPPIAGVTYAGVDLSLGVYGGTWSSDLGTNQRPNAALANDWPDGHGSQDQSYDITAPRLYNENTNRWTDEIASAANSNWKINCIPMLSRANTDLKMNSTETMLPNIHLSGSTRHQAVKDAMRLAFRDIQVNKSASENLGYHDELDYEGAMLSLDYECPADRTYSICAASIGLHFYGSPPGSAGKLAGAPDSAQVITGGIFTTFGPVMPPGSLDFTWIMFAGGFSQFQPKWVVCHKDWTL